MVCRPACVSQACLTLYHNRRRQPLSPIGLSSKCLLLFSGLADPGPVAEALWTDDELEAAVHLDAIITVVDAKHIQQQLQQRSSDGAANEAQKQIAYADSVLLNKVSGMLCAMYQAAAVCLMHIHRKPAWNQLASVHTDLMALLGRGYIWSAQTCSICRFGRQIFQAKRNS